MEREGGEGGWRGGGWRGRVRGRVERGWRGRVEGGWRGDGEGGWSGRVEGGWRGGGHVYLLLRHRTSPDLSCIFGTECKSQQSL